MKKRIMCLIALLCVLTGCASLPQPEPEPGMQIYCFQAGKADAFLIYTDEAAVLIDTGESGFGKEINRYLDQAKITALDYLIVTHFDKDHVGGAAKVLRSVPVRQVLQSNSPKDASAYEKYVSALSEVGITPATVRLPQTITLDGMTITVDPPARESYDEKASNNSSLIVTVEYGEKRFLFMGDAQEERISEYLSADVPHCDFLKVPYHGHWQDIFPDLITAVQPKYAVITCSDDQPEDAKTLSSLTQAGAEVCLTRINPVLLITDGKTISMKYA